MISQQNVPIKFPANVPEEAVLEAVKVGCEILSSILSMLKTEDDFKGFLIGAEADGIKVTAGYQSLDLDSLKALAIKAWWERFEREVNHNLKYTGAKS